MYLHIILHKQTFGDFLCFLGDGEKPDGLDESVSKL